MRTFGGALRRAAHAPARPPHRAEPSPSASPGMTRPAWPAGPRGPHAAAAPFPPGAIAPILRN